MEAPAELLAHMEAELTRVIHDVNNPLTVIYGGAQALVELSQEGGLQKYALDIEEASHVLIERMQQLATLKEQVVVALDQQKGEA